MTDSTRNPLKLLWQYWISASFVANIVIGASLVFLVVAVVGGTVIVNTDQTLTAQTEADMRHTSGLQHSQTDLWVSSMQRQSELISNSQAITNENSTDINTYLHTQLGDLPGDVLALHYIQLHEDKPAESLQSTQTDAIKGDEPWTTFTTSDFADSSTVQQTSPYQYETGGSTYSNSQPALAFVTQSHGNSNRAVVVVVNLQAASQRLTAPDNGRSFVVDHQGTIILSTNPQEVGQNAYNSNYINDQLWNQAHSETSSYATTYYDENTKVGDTRVVTSMAHTDRADWVAYTQVPHSSAFGLRANIQNSMLLLIAGVLLSVILVGLVIGAPTLRDLRRLSETTQRVSDGNYDDPITSTRNDEIGQVFKDVDDMRASLRARISEVENLNTKLQRIVQQQSDVMADVADGDLTQRMDTNTGLAALDDLARDFNNMVEDVRRMVIEIEKSEEEMENFLFIATHDLREPLRMLDTYTDLLEMEYMNKLDDEGEEYMDFITGNSERINAMIEDLYSYLRAKTHDNEYADHDLNTVVEDAQTEIYEEIETSNAAINVQNLPTTQIDARQMREVFEKLMSNAIEYTKPDQHPEIEITGKSNDNTQEHIISVSDNGVGIPDSQYEKIFEVFSRIDRDDNDTGTGIGLAICKRIIEDHDGRIWVESTDGEGSTFHIALPYETQSMQDKFELDRDETDTLNLDTD